MKKTILMATMALPVVLLAQTGSSQDILIEKLQHVNLNLAEKDPSKMGVMLRLADLLAERARLDAMKELEAGCSPCVAGKADREKALKIYREALNKTDPEQKTKILVQMGHLYQLLGVEKLAIDSYQQVLQLKQQGPMAAEANLALAEIYFKKYQFQLARSYYDKVISMQGASSRGFAAYRRAWSDFNLKDYQSAVEGIKRILKTPELQARSQAGGGGQADIPFLEEVSRDLSTFLAQKGFTVAEVEEIYSLSPATTRLQNVVQLALELERTGKKPEAIAAWNFAYERMSVPEKKLEALIHLTPLKFTPGNTQDSLMAMESALQLWSELKTCGSNHCEEYQKILRGFVINWNKTEKKAPSENLQKAYSAYARVFPDDVQMQLWGAKTAQERKNWELAKSFYQAATLEQKKSVKPTELESALLSYLEMGELSKSEALWLESANFYLQHSPVKTKGPEVRYQLAKLEYDKGQYGEGIKDLYNLVTETKVPVSLRVQAAHLTLDALGIMKDDALLQARAQEFAKLLPAQAKDFTQISQKAVLTQSAKLAEGSPEEAWQALTKFESSQASEADRKLYLRNKIILAEKTNRWALAAQSVEEFLKLEALPKEDQDFALAKRAWYAELRLDFTTALNTLEKLATPELKPEQKLLRLAMYADLAGVNSQPYYQNFLKQATESELKIDIAAQLVRKSAKPMDEIKKQASLLKANPELLATLYAEAYVKSPSSQVLNQILADKSVETYPLIKSLWRVKFLNEMEPLRQQAQALSFDASTQKKLAQTIKKRADSLVNIEKLAAGAIQKADWSAQVLALTLLSKESERFYQDLMSLPIPQGLSPEQESEYMNLLAQQAAPYKNKANEASAKLTEFWSSSWQEALQASMNGNAKFRPLVEREVAALREVAEGPHQEFLAQLRAPASTVESASVSLQELEMARNQVREAPFNKQHLEKLLQIEKQNKNLAMVQYLENRIRQNQKEVQP